MKSCEVRLLYTTDHNKVELEVTTTLAQALYHMAQPTWGLDFCDAVCFIYDLVNSPVLLMNKQSFPSTRTHASNPPLPTVSRSFMQWGEPASSRVEKLNQEALQLYKDLIAEGVQEESARAVLPQTLLVKYRVLATPAKISSFIRARDTYTPEMQRLSLLVRDCFEEAPYV